ncbi:MAG: hypothetical protein PHX09_01600 [Clostridia bacterium]|nr:hypothetical protein [Clostridia bacterium]MDD4686207.1 hypothetical protein [Clostridia bacterium]
MNKKAFILTILIILAIAGCCVSVLSFGALLDGDYITGSFFTEASMTMAVVASFLTTMIIIAAIIFNLRKIKSDNNFFKDK